MESRNVHETGFSQEVVDSLPVAIIIADLSTHIIESANRRVMELFPVRAHDLPGCPLAECVDVALDIGQLAGGGVQRLELECSADSAGAPGLPRMIAGEARLLELGGEKKIMLWLQEKAGRNSQETISSIISGSLDVMCSVDDVDESAMRVCEYLQKRFSCDSVSIRRCSLNYLDVLAQGAGDESSFHGDCLCGIIAAENLSRSIPGISRSGSLVAGRNEILRAAVSSLGAKLVCAECREYLQYESVAIIPMRVGGGVCGLLELKDHRRDKFTPGEVGVLERLADSIAMELVRRALHEELEESEMLFKQLFEGMSSGVAIYRMNKSAEEFVLIDMNRRGEEIYGVDKKYLRGHSLEEILPGTEESGMLDAFDEVWRTGEQRHMPLVKHVSNQADLWVEYKLFRLPSGLVVALFEDHTDNKSLGARLRQSDKMIALGTLVSGITHEINNPNGAIQISSTLIKSILESILPIVDLYRAQSGEFMIGGMTYEQAREKIPRLLDGILNSSRRINTIMERLKKFSRVNERNDIPQKLALNTVVKESIDMVYSRIEKRCYDFEVEYADEPTFIEGDFAEIGQVVINLVFNAIESLAEPTQAIRIRTIVDPVESCVSLIVRDSGAGMSDSELSQALTPFYTTKRDHGAVGLGLTVASGIVSEYKGTLRISSERGEGTSVCLTFPLKESRKVV